MSTFSKLLQTFSSYDINSDGIKEIEYLRLLPFEREAESLDPDCSLLIVLVESRLLDPIPGSQYTKDDLLERLQRFKVDLEAEGYHVQGVEAKVYSGPIHQDGRTLLAIRKFFQATRAAYANFRGAIFVGSFPDAPIFRTWTQLDLKTEETIDGHKFSADTKRFNIGCGDHTSRTDIMLADLEGNWEALYEQDPFDIESYLVFPESESSTIVPTANGSKTRVTIKSSPGKFKKTLVRTADTFLIRDADYQVINPDPNNFELAYMVEAANVELSPSDRTQPNPVARPDIIISRINPRSVAVNPDPNFKDVDGRAFLDKQGKPQTVISDRWVDVDDKASFWKRDPALERRLLIDYFDRNHDYRNGIYRDLPFRFSIVEKELSHSLQGTLMKMSSELASPLVKANATLLDYVVSLKQPAFLKVIEAHADPEYAAFGTEYNTGELAAAVGGTPWRWQGNWVDSHYQLAPSLAQQGNAADLYLHRTIWENGILSGTGANLFIHMGCNVNTPKYSLDSKSRPAGASPQELDMVSYDNPRYGVFQNGEGILFYLNGLALLARAKWFFDTPREIGEAFGVSEITHFGACWQRYFEVEAQDALLAKNETDRKRSSMWSILGDWTLRKYYQPYLNFFFTGESIYLATPPLGGYASKPRNKIDPSTHLNWARISPANAVIADLVEKVQLQFGRKHHPTTQKDDPVQGASFFADITLRLQNYGIRFDQVTEPNPNSTNWNDHYQWAMKLLAIPFKAGEPIVRSELSARVQQACTHVLANYRRLLYMIFTTESIYLAKLGGYTHPNRNSLDPALHYGFASSAPLDSVRNDLIDKYGLQMEHLSGVQRAIAYADICLRFNAFGVDFGTISANSLNHQMHQDWAAQQPVQTLKDHLAMRVRRLFEQMRPVVENVPTLEIRTLSTNSSAGWQTGRQLDVGTLDVGQTATAQIRFINTGGGECELGSIQLSGDLSKANTTLTLPNRRVNVIQPSELTVRFTPHRQGQLQGWVKIPTSAPTAPEVAICITCTAQTAILESSPSKLDFGNIRIKETAVQTMTLWNVGNETARDVSVQMVTPGSFHLQGSGNNFDLAPGKSIIKTIEFTPLTRGPTQAALAICYQPNHSMPPMDFNVLVSGRGVAQNVVVSANPLDFGLCALGSTPVLTLQVNNNGDVPAVLNSITLDQDKYHQDFQIITDGAEREYYPHIPYTLGVGASLPLTIKLYVPPANREARSKLLITIADKQACSLEVMMQGRALAPAIMVGPHEIWRRNLSFDELSELILSSFKTETWLQTTLHDLALACHDPVLEKSVRTLLQDLMSGKVDPAEVRHVLSALVGDHPLIWAPATVTVANAGTLPLNLLKLRPKLDVGFTVTGIPVPPKAILLAPNEVLTLGVAYHAAEYKPGSRAVGWIIIEHDDPNAPLQTVELTAQTV